MIEDFVRNSLHTRAVELARVASVALGVVNTFIPFFGAIWGDYLQGLTLDALRGMIEDDDAIDRVVCCWYQALKDEPLLFATWRDGLDDCNFDFPDNAAQIAGIVQTDLTETNFRAYSRDWQVQRQRGTDAVTVDALMRKLCHTTGRLEDLCMTRRLNCLAYSGITCAIGLDREDRLWMLKTPTINGEFDLR